jgi:folate-binding protein YgfZ
MAQLSERGVIAVEGADRVGFLQGLVSNDVAEVGPGRAVWAALLSPQGKWLADFFILADGERLLLDCERQHVAMLVSRLSRYRLRSQVAICDASREHAVHVAWDGPPGEIAGAVIAPDPRLPEAGWRIVAPGPLATAKADEAQWDRHRLALGLPDGSRDLDADKTVLLEAGFDELHGISWSKGCYMGQELTARTKYRGLVKRRLVPVVALRGPLPERGAPIVSGAADAGTMRSGRDDLGLASLRIEALAGPLRCGETELVPQIPAWMTLPA